MTLDDINIRDPYILNVNGKYYMYGTRGSEAWGKCTGLDVYISDDLENWSDAIEAFTPPENFWSDTNFWAPEVHFYNGNYYMFVSFVSDTRLRGTQILKSEKPEGPFSVHSDGPVTPEAWQCLDGTFLLDSSKPYIVFCREWVQVKDGEIWAMELTADLKETKGEPIYLFKASDPAWSDKGRETYVTDGPFMYRSKNGKLLMIWSTFSNHEYCQAIAYSDNGHINGNWIHDERLLFEKNGGHGMIFRTNENDLKLVLHSPNKTPEERPVIFDLTEKNDTLYIENFK